MSQDDESFEFKDYGLKDLLKLISNEIPQARLGVLGNSSNREGSESNASIAMKHEFGEITKINGKDVKLPVRSIFRIPLMEQFQKYLEKSGLTQESFEQVVKNKSWEEFAKKIALVGEVVVLDAFATGGFRKWKPSDMEFKKNKQTLVETQQLRNSITSEVK